MTYLHKNKRFWKALQQIRALFANRNGCYIFALYSESYIHKKKKFRGEHAKLYSKSYSPFLHKKVIQEDQVIQGG